MLQIVMHCVVRDETETVEDFFVSALHETYWDYESGSNFYRSFQALLCSPWSWGTSTRRTSSWL